MVHIGFKLHHQFSENIIVSVGCETDLSPANRTRTEISARTEIRHVIGPYKMEMDWDLNTLG